MGPNYYMLQICDRYFRTYILQIFYRTVRGRWKIILMEQLSIGQNLQGSIKSRTRMEIGKKWWANFSAVLEDKGGGCDKVEQLG
jgi:hypothetical protein